MSSDFEVLGWDDSGNVLLKINRSNRSEVYRLTSPSGFDDDLIVELEGKTYRLPPKSVIAYSGDVPARTVLRGLGVQSSKSWGDADTVPELRVPNNPHGFTDPTRPSLNSEFSDAAERASKMRDRAWSTAKWITDRGIWKNYKKSLKENLGVELNEERMTRNREHERARMLAARTRESPESRARRVTQNFAVLRRVKVFLERPNRWSEELGRLGALSVALSLGHHILIGDDAFDDQPLKRRIFNARGAGTIDLVTIDPRDNTIHIWEAKGGIPHSVSRDLGKRWIPDPDSPDNRSRDIRVTQMSRLYARFVMQNDREFRAKLKEYDLSKGTSLLADIEQGKARVIGHVVKLDTDLKIEHHEVNLGEKIGFLLPGRELPKRKYGPPDGSNVARATALGGIASVPFFSAIFGNPGEAVAAEIADSESMLLTAGAIADPGLGSEWQNLVTSVDVVGYSLKAWIGEQLNVVNAYGLTDEILRSLDEGVSAVISVMSRFSSLFMTASILVMAWAVGQQILNLLMRANPFGAIATAVGLAIAGIVLIVENWDSIKVLIDGFYQGVLVPLGKWFADAWNETIVPIFQTCVDAVSGFFSGIANTISGAWEGLINGVKNVLRWIADKIDYIPGTGAVQRAIRRFTDPEEHAEGGLVGSSPAPISWADSTAGTVDSVAGNAESSPAGAAPRFADGGLVSIPDWDQFFTADVGATTGSTGAIGADVLGASTVSAQRNGVARFRSGGSVKASGATAAARTADTVSTSAIDQTIDSLYAPALLDAATHTAGGAGWNLAERFADGGEVTAAPAVAHAVSAPIPGDSMVPEPQARLAAGGSVLSGAGAVGGFVNPNLSLLDAIMQDSSGLSSLAGQVQSPTRAVGRGKPRTRKFDRSLAIHIASPDVDADFFRSRAEAGQRALTYAGRWN